jgi:S-adenosylmethionine-dependent methyltransferase
MEKTTTRSEVRDFQSGAEKYAAYLETPEGRLRLDLGFANLQEFFPRPTQQLHALDLGGGTGALAVRLAQLGIHVTLLDASREMLDLATRAALEAGVGNKVLVKHGDVAQLANLFDGASFDVILCHNVLEFVEDPVAVLSNAARILRDPPGVISVLVRNHAGEVLKAALVSGDLAAAERNLTSEWGDEALYGGKVRLFFPESLRSMLAAASLTVTAERGVRVVSDYLPAKISRIDEYDRIFELERELGRRPEFAAVARYTQCIAHPRGAAAKDGA